MRLLFHEETEKQKLRLRFAPCGGPTVEIARLGPENRSLDSGFDERNRGAGSIGEMSSLAGFLVLKPLKAQGPQGDSQRGSKGA